MTEVLTKMRVMRVSGREIFTTESSYHIAYDRCTKDQVAGKNTRELMQGTRAGGGVGGGVHASHASHASRTPREAYVPGVYGYTADVTADAFDNANQSNERSAIDD